MMDTLTTREQVMDTAASNLERLFEHVRLSNPFAANRVVASSAASEDVEDIHHAQYLQLLDVARRAAQQEVGIGALLWGEAGIGKSHLLARLGKWAGSEQKQAIYVYLSNLQAAPEHLPRSLLRSVLSILTLGRTNRFFLTPLYRLVNAAILHALHDNGAGHEYSWPEAVTAYERLVDDLCNRTSAQAALVDRPTYAVLFRFFISAYLNKRRPDDGIAALAVRWLAGDFLDPDEAKKLSLPSTLRREDGVALADDEQIKRVLIALAQIAAFRRQPLLLCFDQVDNLAAEQFAALARFLHALLDCAGNLLIVTSGVRDSLLRWTREGVIQKSSWERLAQYEIELQRISVPQARRLVQMRLHSFQDPFMALPQVKDLVQHDGLFPLGEAWATEFLADKIDVRPRDVINWAREGWQRQVQLVLRRGGVAWLEEWQQHMPPVAAAPALGAAEIHRLIDDKVALKIQEHVQQRQLEPQTLPPDGDNLAGLLHTLLKQCCQDTVERVPRPKYGPKPTCDLVVKHPAGADGREARSGVLCLVVSNRVSMAAFLRRLAQDAEPPDRLFVIADERCPLNPGPGGNEYLEELRRRHGSLYHQVQLRFADYAALDALQGVVGLARSGDLEIELPGGQAWRVSEAEVHESHRRQSRYSAHSLLRLLLEPPTPSTAAAAPAATPAAAETPAATPADDGQLRQFILDRLAITLFASSKELTAHYQEQQRIRQHESGLELCKTQLEGAAKQLHQEGVISATPQDDYLMLVLKK
jgi:hypothetical protein